MPLSSGVHVECTTVGGSAPYAGKVEFIPLHRRLVWSETLASVGGATAKSAPLGEIEHGAYVFSITSAQDAWIAIGPSPDAAKDPRRYVPAKTTFDISVAGGDRLA